MHLHSRSRSQRGQAAAAFLASCLCLLAAGSGRAEILSARYIHPTSVYDHGAVPGGEYEAIEFHLSGGGKLISKAGRAVYEDTEPRLVDVNGDGRPEVISVISYFDQGAALRIWTEGIKDGEPTVTVLAETPPIGRKHRWLAVVGAADLDGDGLSEVAYVDRPHLAKTLRIWRYADGGLKQVATQAGLTNHRIGETFISGGIRDCGQGPEIVTVDSGWTKIVATRFDGKALTSRDIANYVGKRSMSDAMACRD